jgi:ABC-2 type transport system ATP-binding protein
VSPVAGDAAIRCDGVTKRFGPVVALDRLDLSVPSGKVTGYLGPNGAGKSTTIRILLDLARANAGEVRVLGAEPRAAGAPLRRRIGYLPGELRLDERLSVAETLRSWERLRGTPVDPAYLARLCERLDLDPGRETKGLSSGNRRKVGLVGAFMARPELLVLDEPTGGLDPLMQAEFLTLVEEVRDEGRTVFLSSHVLSEVQRVADEVIVLRAGRVVATGSVEELRHAARQRFTAWFAAAPPVDELRATPGVTDVEVHGNEVSGIIAGPPKALLATLARHDVVHLLLPEPDLEDAFLRFYAKDEPAEDDAGAAGTDGTAT